MGAIKHFWLLKYKDNFYEKKRGEDLYVQLPRDILRKFIEVAVNKTDGKTKVALCNALNEFKFIRPTSLTDWEKRGSALPLWAIKIIALLIACNGDAKLARSYLKKIVRLEIESKFENIENQKKDNIENRYFELLLALERAIPKIFVRRIGGVYVIKNPFPLNIEDPAKKWAELLGYLVLAGFLIESGLQFQNRRNKWVVKDLKECVDSIFGTDIFFTEKVYKGIRSNIALLPNFLVLFLQRCFEDKFLLLKNIPREIKEADHDTKKRFLRAVFNDHGHISISRELGKLKSINIRFYYRRLETIKGIKALLDDVVPSRIYQYAAEFVFFNKTSKERLMSILRKREDILFELGYKDIAEADKFFSSYSIKKSSLDAAIKTMNRHLELTDGTDAMFRPSYKIHITNVIELNIEGIQNVQIFMREIGFSEPEKAKRAKVLVDIFEYGYGKTITTKELQEVIQAELEDANQGEK